MSHASPVELRVLLALRVAGVLETDDLADQVGLSDVEAMRALERLLDAGEVVRTTGPTGGGWQLADEVEADLRRRARDDLDASGGRDVVEHVADRYVELDDRVLDLTGRWQRADGGLGPNPHTDEQRDHELVQALVDLHHEVAAACASLAEELERYEPYGVRLHGAVEHVLAGRGDWFAGDLVPSYGRVSGQLREDLLVSTGRWPEGVRRR